MMSVLSILSIIKLFSPASKRNFEKKIDLVLFPFLITRMFIDKFSFLLMMHSQQQVLIV